MVADKKIVPNRDLGQRVSTQNQSQTPSEKRTATLPFIVTFIIMIGFWLIFSGKLDVFHLSLGVISCLLVTFFSSDLLFPNGLKTGFLTCWIRFAWYVPWLLYQILLANLHVLRLCFHPRMMTLIDPHIIDFNSHLESDIARTTFANSITLTPGTITVNISAMGRFTVHCIDVTSGNPLPGEMERQIKRIFKE
ncbi:MAG: Na+/H+ antiporter subunit E [Thermodesulfobacteriota bacterium]